MTVLEQRFGEESAAPRASHKAAPASTSAAAAAAAAVSPRAGAGVPPSAFAGRFSQEGSERQQGTLRKLAAGFMGVPGVVSLSGGFPPADLFPFEGISITLRGTGETVTINDPSKVGAAQQYNLALRGYPPLVRWAETHVQALHAPPGSHEVAITNGCNHTVEVLVSLLLERGDSVLMEEYTYPHMLECVAAPKGLHVVPLPIDSQGIIPEAMEQVLERLSAQQAAGAGNIPFPKVLYTIPTAQNPTGASITPARRRAVYSLCSRYNILILEDDPYFYLQFPQGTSSTVAAGAAAVAAGSAAAAAEGPTSGCQPPESTGTAAAVGAAAGALPGLGGPGGSYLSLDSEGRVARVDSFAKFLSPGLRLGWITAPPDLLAKVVMALQAHTVGPCSLSQVVVAETLAAWGDAGLQRHLRGVQEAYARRAAVMLEAAEQELQGVAEWECPTGGMFLWMRLLGVGDAGEVWGELQRHKLVVLPGRVMHPRASDPTFQSPYVRISFSHAPDDQIREGMRRLGQVLRAHRAAAAAGESGIEDGVVVAGC